ncbi:MAG: ATP-binding protein [Pirellulaceae bacterium]
MKKSYDEMTRPELLAELAHLSSDGSQAAKLELLGHDLEIQREQLRAQRDQLLASQSQNQISRDAYAELYDFAPVAYLLLDPHGLIRAINLTGSALLERERSKLIDTRLHAFIIPPDRPAFLEHMRHCRETGSQVVTELSIQTSTGRFIPVQLISRRQSQNDYRTIINDLTERRRAEAAIGTLNAGLEVRVTERTAQLLQANAQLLQEVTFRKEAEAALIDASRRKDEFLAMLAHELRNPLSPIRSATDFLRLVLKDDQDCHEMLTIISRQADHMARIVDDLLDVSRITRGKISLDFEVLNWSQLVREVVEDISAELAASELAIHLELPEEPIWVSGDETRLSQVVSNLLHNARKFTDRGGSVAIRLTVDRSNAEQLRAMLSVRDTGIGIASDMLGRLFTPFNQADRSLDRSRGGLGLGLALVKGLVELHGGTITAVSEGLGTGAEFTVCLALTHAPAAVASPPADGNGRQSLRVLIIDDQHDTVHTMDALLKNLGHEVFTAYDGEEGVRIARQMHPQVIFSDIGLPGMDGYSVARSVRADPQMRSAYLVAVTGYGQQEDRRRALEAGFDRHLTKPIPFQELKGVLAGLL